MQSLQTGNLPPLEAFEWFDAIEPSLNRVMTLVFVPTYPYIDEAIRLCGRAKYLIGKQSTSPDLLIDAINIIQASNDLERSINERFQPMNNASSVTTTTQQQDRGLLQSLHNRVSFDGCFLCLQYRVLELLLYILNLPDISITERETISRLQNVGIQQCQSRAERILTSSQSFLSNKTQETSTHFIVWADAMRLMWPIQMVAVCSVVLESQKEDARSILMKIAYEVGIMHAVDTSLIL
jgi:hypothetical protein